jgi:hypothetical protein
MRFIVTKQNADGTFDEVGMNNRVPCRSLKRAKEAAKFWAKQGHKVRVEGWDLESYYNPWSKPSYLKFFG